MTVSGQLQVQIPGSILRHHEFMDTGLCMPMHRPTVERGVFDSCSVHAAHIYGRRAFQHLLTTVDEEK